MRISNTLMSVGKRMAFTIGILVCCGMMSIAIAQSDKESVSAKKKAKPELVDAIAAVVDTDVITRTDLNTRVGQVMRNMKTKGGAVPQLAELQKQVLEHIIVERIQLHVAKDAGIRVEDNALDAAISRIAEQNKMTVADFRKKVERDGTPFMHFREQIREEIIIRRLREKEVENKIQVSDSEIENFLTTFGMSQDQQEYNLGHILIRIPENASPEQIEQRNKRATEVLQKLRSGVDFAKTAISYSDAENALEGGDMGWRLRERLPQAFGEAATNMKIGEISSIIKSANGFHILKLIGRRSSNAKAMPMPTAVQQTHARHILIKVNQVVSSDEARRKLIDLKQRIDNNAATFEELAKTFSNDFSAKKGGDLGWIYPGDTVPEFERAMNALKPGQVSEPIETPFGFHLIEVVERKTDELSQERLKMVARQAIRARKLDDAMQEWLRQLRDSAYVEYRLDEK
jgi:peptidyl-prolyl cis-trans isomerase SurA